MLTDSDRGLQGAEQKDIEGFLDGLTDEGKECVPPAARGTSGGGK